MYGERSMSWLPRVCSHGLLKPSAPRREKSIDLVYPLPLNIFHLAL